MAAMSVLIRLFAAYSRHYTATPIFKTEILFSNQ